MDIAPLTILSGSNSAGKSPSIQPVLLIKQTMEVAYDPGPLLLAGTNVGFSSAAEMFWRGRPTPDVPADCFEIGFRDTDGEYNRLKFGLASHGVELLEMQYRLDADSRLVTLSPSVSPREIAEGLGAPWLRADTEREWPVVLHRNRCFFEIGVADSNSVFGFGPYPALRGVASGMLHLPGLRDNPARFYPATQVGDVFPGVFQPYVASVIQSWADAKDERLAELGRQLQALGLTWKVTTKRVDDTRVAIRVGRLPRSKPGGSRDLVNIVDVGLGVSQTLPVLVALLLADRGQYVFLEQPEIHLHPRAQVALAETLLSAALRGVRVIVETHSYLLLRAIQEAAVRLGVPENTVGLNWFSRDPDGMTHIDSTYLASNGSFGEWPNDFAEVEMDVEDRYLAAVVRADRIAG